jgi:hypothetical protein
MLASHKLASLPALKLVRMRPQVGHRLSLALMTLAIFAVSIFEPSSMNYRLIEAAGFTGVLNAWLLACMAGWSVVDAIVNDLMPDRFQLERTRQWRHLGYGGMAMLNGSFILVMVTNDALSWLTSVYAVMAFSACWIAVWDVLTVVTEAQHRE